jgi:hypothetical protein
MTASADKAPLAARSQRSQELGGHAYCGNAASCKEHQQNTRVCVGFELAFAMDYRGWGQSKCSERLKKDSMDSR